MSNNNSNRGFASMDENKQRKIASKGGKASGGGNRSRGSNASGAAGRTEAAKRGGEQSHGNQYIS